MGRSASTTSSKRKKPEPKSHSSAVSDADLPVPELIQNEEDMGTDDLAVLEVIKNTEDMGTWKRAIKYKTRLSIKVVDKFLDSLLSKKLIKVVVNIQNKKRKHYMAVEFEPAKEISGGVWYVNGELDKECIDVLKNVCLKIIGRYKVAAVEQICDFLKLHKVTTFNCTEERIVEILNLLVLDNEIIEVKSTGWGEYHSVPVGTICYRLGSRAGLRKGLTISAMASNPCGRCPQINKCTPDGLISPATCVYYKKWLGFEF